MLLHDEESKTDDIMDRLVDDPEFKQVLRSKMKAIAIAMATSKDRTSPTVEWSGEPRRERQEPMLPGKEASIGNS
jgi:hypothetical protein